MSKLLAKHQNINREAKAPKLRFNSFDESWRESTFGELFTFFPTNSLSREFLQQEAGKIKNIHYGDIHTRYRSLFDIAKEQVPFLNENVSLKIDEKSYCQAGDIIFADASEDYLDIGKCIEIANTGNQKVTAGLHTLLARPNKKIFAKGFLAQLMRSGTVRKQIMILAQGTKVLGISARHLNKLIFKLPSKSEQEKIADFFTNIDEWITNLRLQQTELEKYKKATLKKIFSKQIRFKNNHGDFYQDWTEKKFGDFLIREQRVVDKPTGNFTGIGIRSHFKGTFQRKNIEPNVIAMEKLFLVKSGDFILNITFAWEGAAAIAGDEDENCFVSHRFPTFTFKKDVVIPNYFKYVFTEKRMKYIFGTISPGGAGRNRVLNIKDLLKIRISVPSIEEQEKISSFLSSIDKLIANKGRQINLAEQWKKGLLQQMFV